MTDSERRAQAQRLVETYSDMILRLSYTYLHNTQDAEDICQETLIKLLYQSRRFSSPEHEKAWVIRTAANACKDILKRPDRSRTCALEACADQAAPASERRRRAGRRPVPAPGIPRSDLPALLRRLHAQRDRRPSVHSPRHRRHPSGPGQGTPENHIRGGYP